MKTYILWLENMLDTKEKQENFTCNIKKVYEKFREMVRGELKNQKICFHDRTPEGIASILVAFEYFTKFLFEKNIIDCIENKKINEEMIEICLEICKNQSESMKTVSVSKKFIQNIITMQENENIYIKSKESFVSCQNECIGFYDNDFYYLNMTATIKNIRKFCLEQGEPMPTFYEVFA